MADPAAPPASEPERPDDPDRPLPTRDGILGAFDLTGRVAIVTGGSRGIGRAVAGGFAAMGASVVIASRKAEACEHVVGEIEAAGGRALAVPTHIGRIEDLDRLVEATVKAFGRIDIVMNNGANAVAQPIGELTAEAWQKSLDTNVRSAAFLTQAALPHLEASGHGSVINTVTIGIFSSGQGIALYAAGKSALQMLTRTMAAELAPRHIRVNSIAPGVIDTQMVRNNPPEIQQWMMSGQPMGRMGVPDELVPAALYLASDASSFVTGQCLVVDGGQSTH